MQLIIHIGQHKTGTKALQFFLSQNAKILKEHLISYETCLSDTDCHAYRHSHYHWFRELKQVCTSESTEALRQFKNTFTQHIQKSQELSCTRCVVSAEDLWVMQTAHELEWNETHIRQSIRLLKQLSQDFSIELKVVIYLKNSDDFLKSSYAQYIKGESRGTLRFKKFKAKFKERVDMDPIISIWKKELPAHSLIIQKYSNHKNWDIRQDFIENIIKTPIRNLNFELPADGILRTEVINKSPGMFSLIVLRHKNLVRYYKHKLLHIIFL